MTQIKLRRDIAADWTSADPVLALGETGWETDTNKVKLGDGSTPWNLLPYVNEAELDDLQNNKADIFSPAFTGNPTAPTPSPGDNDTSLATTQFVTAAVAAASAGIPTGTVLMGGWTAAPAGYLLCDGTAVSRTTYAALFAAVSTAYGPGDGSTTFNLPNSKGRVPVGRDAAQTEFDVLGETGGAKSHTLTSGEMPSHTHVQNSHGHSISDPGHAHTYAYYGGVTAAAGSVRTEAGSNTGSTQSSGTGISIVANTAINQNTGGGGAHNNLQPYLTFNFAIKT